MVFHIIFSENASNQETLSRNPLKNVFLGSDFPNQQQFDGRIIHDKI